jgi:hypothetical protein
MQELGADIKVELLLPVQIDSFKYVELMLIDFSSHQSKWRAQSLAVSINGSFET